MLFDKMKEFSFPFISKQLSTPVEVFVRHCHFSEVSAHKKRPSWFSRKACFDNLLATAKESKSVHMTILLDTFQPMQNEHFVLHQDLYPVVQTKQGTEGGSFCYMMDYVLSRKLSDETIIYFLEDDYLHKEGWVDVLREGFSLEKSDYVTLYDHKDKYFLPCYDELYSKIYVTKSSHWRQTPSTTNTFAAKLSTLKRDQNIQYEYSKGKKITEDHAKFCRLAESGALLISAIPGWSSHLEPEYLSPCIDWHALQKATAKLSIN